MKARRGRASRLPAAARPRSPRRGDDASGRPSSREARVRRTRRSRRSSSTSRPGRSPRQRSAARTAVRARQRRPRPPAPGSRDLYRPVELRSLIDAGAQRAPAVVASRTCAWHAGDDERARPSTSRSRRSSTPAAQSAGVERRVHRRDRAPRARSRSSSGAAASSRRPTRSCSRPSRSSRRRTRSSSPPNEELETTNEELQSTNEELETMNEELQSTNEELETMNDELRERTDETLNGANAFLESVLASIQQGVVVVDRDAARQSPGTAGDASSGGCATTRWRASTSSTSTSASRCSGSATRSAGCSPAAPSSRLELDGHDRRGKPVRVSIEFAPLQSLPGGRIRRRRDPARLRRARRLSWFDQRPSRAFVSVHASPATGFSPLGRPRPRLVFFYSPQSGRCRRVEGFIAQVLQRRWNHDTSTWSGYRSTGGRIWRRSSASRRCRRSASSRSGSCGRRIVAPRGCRELERELEPWLR